MRYILQISCGSWDRSDYTLPEVIKRVSGLVSGLDVYGVIIGWGPDRELYLGLREYLSERGVKMFLWLPVFSALNDLMTSDMSVDLWGKFLPRSGDGFDFCCPSSRRNIDNVKNVFDSRFASSGFDGVFLDRVRGESFARGISGVMSCCCPACRERFAGLGVSLDDVASALAARGDHFFDAIPSQDGLLELSDPAAKAFFRAKGKIVSGSVSELSRHFRQRGLTVGLDLFAPVVSPLVGQDYGTIASSADFVKPMLYRRTLAPAGMGYEMELVRREAPDAAGWDACKTDSSFLASQVRQLRQLPCGAFPGVEVNHDPRLVPTDPEYIRESLEIFEREGADGAVLSWNIMSAPDENLSFLTRH